MNKIDDGKKRNGLQNLGVEVEIDTKELENDAWAQKMLREIGATMKVPGMKYIGSAAIHYYIEEDTIAKTQYSFASKNQFALGDLNERLASTGLTNLAIAMKRHFGRAHTTTNTKDRRGK